MPPEEEKQPSESEKKILKQWLDSQLTGKAAKALAEKLERFEYGNVVNHEDLFSGEYADLPRYSHDRRWMISEFIFNEKVNRLLDYKPTRTIYGTSYEVAGDSGVHWSPKTERGNKFRRTITNPFSCQKRSVSGTTEGSPDDRSPADHGWQCQADRRAYVVRVGDEVAVPSDLRVDEGRTQGSGNSADAESFLATYGYMERILREIYGDRHEDFCPSLFELIFLSRNAAKKVSGENISDSTTRVYQHSLQSRCRRSIPWHSDLQENSLQSHRERD